MLVVDMNNEYIDYYMQMNKIAREGGSFLRSWDMGMGLNMLGLIAFYAASPLNLLLLITPAGSITETVLVITVIKFGLCGLFFSVYTSYAFGREDAVNLACSTAYAMMGYNVAYSSNLMWLDGVALLPLVLMGVEKILREGKYRQYIISLVFVFFTSYYIGYMLGIFTFLYFTARFFTENAGFGDYLRALRRFLLGAVLAAGCCSVLLLPAFLNLRSGQNAMWGLSSSSLAMKHPLVKIAAKLLPGVYDSLTDSGLPNIFVTTAVVLLAVLFFLNKRIPLREKLVFGVFAAFMALSFSWGILDLAWHAFEPPTWFPARYSFVFGFLLLHIALRGLRVPSGLSTVRILAGVLLTALLFAEIALSGYEYVSGRQVITGIFLVIAYGGVTLAVASGGRGRNALLMLGLALVCAESYYSAASLLGGIDAQFQYRLRKSYYDYRDEYLPAVELAEREYPGAHRVETLEQRNANGGMALGYRGISHYSSTTYQALNALLRRLGYNTGTINELRFAKNTPLTNGLLGIRHVLAREEIGVGYELVNRVGRVDIYENTAAFPLAFFAGEEALHIDYSQPDPFLLQNRWVQAMFPDSGLPDVFYPLETGEEELQNLVPDLLEGGALRYARPLRDTDGVLEINVYNPDGLEAYAFFPVYQRKFAKAEAFVDDRPAGSELAYRNNTVLQLGSDEWIRVALRISSDDAYMNGRLIYGLDLAAARAAADLARQHSLQITRFGDTALAGKIFAPQSGILATSIPYDQGWTVRVDGEETEIKRLMGVFLAVELPEGKHSIVMRYIPPGFAAGAALSLISVLGMAVWPIVRRRREYS